MNVNKLKLVALALVLFITMVGSVCADDAITMTRELQGTITPDKALDMLKHGNERFISGNALKRDILAQVKQTSEGQFPFAAIVS